MRISTIKCRSNAPILAPLLDLLVSQCLHTHPSHLCPRPYPVHPQVGEIVAGAHQQLGWVAAAAVCAYLRSNAARTRLCSPPDSLNFPQNTRRMTSDACTCDSPRAQLRCALSFSFRHSNLAARLDSTHTSMYAHGPFKRTPICVLTPSLCLASHTYAST